LFNSLSNLVNYVYIFFLILFFILNFGGIFFDLSTPLSIVLYNDLGSDFDLFENWVLSFNYFYIIYTFILFLPKIFFLYVNFLENIFFDNLDAFCKSDVVLSYNYFTLDANSISIFTEVFTNLILFKVDCLFNELLDFNVEINSNFLYNNPIFFYSGFLFLFSTLFSLIFMSYLGLYGVFITNLITLFTL